MKKVLAALLILVMALSVAQLNSSIANPYIETPAITITQPSPSFLTCYKNTSIPLTIEVRVLKTDVPNVYIPQIKNISYNIDNNQNITLTSLNEGAKFYADSNTIGVTLNAKDTIENLTEGNHVLKAYSYDSNGQVLATEITFTVDSSYEFPTLLIISPQNETYSSKDVPLTFSINKEYRNAQYLIDEDFSSGKFITITGNTTLTNLSNGTHKILIKAVAIDNYHHNGTPIGQFTFFNINNTTANMNPNMNPVPSNTDEIIIISIIGLLITTTALIIYRRKRTRLTQKES